MTKELWFNIPDFSLYQINSKGEVRIKPNRTKPYYKDHGGELVPLLGSDGPYPSYHLVSDTQGLCVITKDCLVKTCLSIENIIQYIKKEWPEVTDPQHCASLLLNAQTTDDLDKGICHYQRNLHDF